MRAITLRALLVSWIAFVLTPVTSADEPKAREEPVSATGVAVPRKLALLVGIGKYSRGNKEPKWKDWWDLASRKDVEKIANVLASERYGFKTEDVRQLLDETATREGIEQAFRTHLIDQARPGDVVYFHYSGHGQQVADQNGDEFDGLDESLVPYDYISQKQEDGAKSNLRDDTLGELLEQLQQKMSSNGQLKGSITVTLDSCFSGSGTRGTLNGGLVARGRAWDSDQEIDGPKPKTNARGKVDSPAGLLAEGQARAKSYVLLTAASYDQLAAEIEQEGIGLFSDAWVNALSAATNRTTVHDVYEYVYGKVTARATRQDPTLEGNGRTLLFSGVAVERSDYVVVQTVGDNDFTLPVGETFGVTLGSVYAIYKQGRDVSDLANKIAEAEITQVRGASCTATLSAEYRGKLPQDSLRAARAVEISHNYRNEKPLRVFFAEKLPAPVTDAIRSAPVVQIDGVARGDHDVLARLDKGNANILILEDELGSMLTIDSSSKDAAQKIKDALLRNWRKRFLMRVVSPVSASRIAVEARLVPVDVNAVGNEVEIKGARTDDHAKAVSESRHTINLHEREYFQLEVRNVSKGTAKVYFTVLHFQPDGTLEVDYPEFDEAAVAPNQEWIPLPECVYKSTAHRDGRPAQDVYKVFATRVETRFGDLLPKRGGQTRSSEEVAAVFKGNRGKPRGESDDSFDLDRMIGYAMLGRDPVQGSSRSENVSSRAADWSVTTLNVMTRPGMKQ